MQLNFPEKLTEEQIISFKKIFKDTYGYEISREKAIVEGLELIHFIAIFLELKYNKN